MNCLLRRRATTPRPDWAGPGQGRPAPRRLLAAIAAAVPVIALAVAGTTAARADSAPAAPGTGWTTVFDDDFAGPAGSAPNSYNWMYDTGPGSDFGTGEIETMTSSASNVYLDGNGHLDITALDNAGSWTSGRIQTTSPDVGAPAGGELEVTASIEQPDAGDGYWPAFWMLGPGQWPENGEIDIMEDVNSLSQVSGTIHCGTDPGGPCDEPDGIGSGLTACSGCESGYHTYTMILNRTNTADESITFYLDGNAYFSVSESQVGTSTWQAAFDHNMSIILDLAIGGGYPDGVCGCTTPDSTTAPGGTMSVAYVAAYESTGAALGPTGPITGYDGLCVDDRSASTANYNPVQVYTCNGTDAQQWTFDQADDTLQVLGMCLDIYAGGTTDGTLVDLFYCDGSGAQVWQPQSDGALYNPQSGKCLDDTNWSTTPGTQLQIWDCTGNANQQWALP